MEQNFHRQWFKFYGQDWLTDGKIVNLSIEDRLCFITLLCLASSSEEQGVIKGYSEDSIISLTHLYDNPYDDNNEVSRSKGFINRLVEMEMIEVTNSNENSNGQRYAKIEVCNFLKRQGSVLTSAERQARFREKQKLLEKTIDNKGIVTHSNAIVTHSNAIVTQEKRREEKRRVLNTCVYDNSFEEFWTEYPLKMAKTKAFESWKRLSTAEKDKCVVQIKLQVSNNHFKGNDGQDYIPHPATWLNQKRWEDEIKKNNTPKGVMKL
jgi:hypothetical protein